tara:strand:+ start:7934 stop:8488 length:555 start_codon:yes stop_codon:yes gene_type:complete
VESGPDKKENKQGEMQRAKQVFQKARLREMVSPTSWYEWYQGAATVHESGSDSSADGEPQTHFELIRPRSRITYEERRLESYVVALEEHTARCESFKADIKGKTAATDAHIGEVRAVVGRLREQLAAERERRLLKMAKRRVLRKQKRAVKRQKEVLGDASQGLDERPPSPVRELASLPAGAEAV